jgi:G6PDH family F420-dependent oxidoreductase
MAEIGLALSSEELAPGAIVETARLAEEHGLRSVAVSDHFHPWTDRQGESSFVWSVIGAIAGSTRLKVTTAVTCPTVRIHPAVLAQAAATAQLLLGGRFVFGVGSGEALNEHVLGDRWPLAPERLEMLDEAVAVMRELWRGGVVDHDGRHYRVSGARLYSLPEQPPPVVVSAFGEKSLELAARIGDGLMTTEPSAETVRRYRELGGRGPVVGQLKVCFGRDEEKAVSLAHELWAVEQLGGQTNQELPMPAHFAAAAALVRPEQVASSVPCGPDPERHVQGIREYLEAGFDEVYVGQIGPDQRGFLEFYQQELAPRLR